MGFFLRVCAFLIFTPGLATAATPPVEFSSAQEISDTGYITLTWSNPAGAYVTVEQSLDENFTEAQQVYRGREASIFLSGLTDGTYFYRLIGEEHQTLDSMSVSVEHHSLLLSGTLFLIGGAVFLATFVVILKGER